MKSKFLLVGVLVLGFAMPTAVAHHAADESEASTEGLPDVGLETYYVDVDSNEQTTLWRELNGHDGLQTERTTYEASNDQCAVDGDTFEENDPATDDDDVCHVLPDFQYI